MFHGLFHGAGQKKLREIKGIELFYDAMTQKSKKTGKNHIIITFSALLGRADANDAPGFLGSTLESSYNGFGLDKVGHR